MRVEKRRKHGEKPKEKMSREIKSPKAPVSISKSWDGKHTLEFSESSHRYKLDGKACPGVTTILKGGYVTSMGLISWFKSQTANALFQSLTVPGQDGYQPREGFYPITEKTKEELIKEAKAADRTASQEAADVGTVLHSFAELHSLGKLEEANNVLDQVRGVAAWQLIESCVRKYKEWDAKNKGELVAAEALVASPTHLFCGKIDRLDRVNGKLRLRDYKTSKSIYLDNFIQEAAYAVAIQEWMNLHVDELEILRFGKEDGEFETMLIDDPKEILAFKMQALRCRATYEFRKLENDPRWKYEGK